MNNKNIDMILRSPLHISNESSMLYFLTVAHIDTAFFTKIYVYLLLSYGFENVIIKH